MNLDRSFGYLVHDVARLFARRFNDQALLFLGLTRAQCRLLGYLARHEGIHQAGLAELLEIKPMTLVRQIDRMEEKGWIERRPDPADRRARRLVLTEKARPLLARILDLSAAVRREAFADLSEDEGRHLVDLLRRVHDSLSDRLPLPAIAARPNANGPNVNGPNANGPNANGPNANGPNANGPNANGPADRHIASGARLAADMPAVGGAR